MIEQIHPEATAVNTQAILQHLYHEAGTLVRINENEFAFTRFANRTFTAEVWELSQNNVVSKGEKIMFEAREKIRTSRLKTGAKIFFKKPPEGGNRFQYHVAGVEYAS